ncbi:hypothetical protein SBADM41S_03472 [Streptomyces badius]
MQGGAAGAFRAAAGGLDDLGKVVGAGDGGEAAGRGDVQFAAAFQGLLGPVENGLDTPAGAGAPGAHLALPSVERALFAGGPDAGADGFARVVGPQPPGSRLEGVAYGGGEVGRALVGGREAGEDGQREGAQAGVVVAQGQLVQGPGPVGAGGRVAAEQGQGVVASVGGEVAEDGERQTGAGVVGIDVVVGIGEVSLDLLDTAVEVEVEARVVKGAVLHLPVVAGVAHDAVVEGREGLGARCGERVERAVAAAPLQQAEQGAARRYERIEHGRKPHIKLSTQPGLCSAPCLSARGDVRGDTVTPRSDMIGRPPSFAWCRASSSASRRWP